jgi:rod shape-determining protein MreC
VAQEIKRKTGILFAGIVVCLFAGARFFWSDLLYVDQYLSYCTYPLLVAQNKCVEPIKQFFTRRHTIAELYQKIEHLEQERDDAREKVIELSAHLAFAQDVSGLTEFRKSYDASHAVLVQVLLKNLSEQEQYFFVDGGANQQIQKDMVAVYKNNLIGRVVEVFPTYSKVMLVSDRMCKVAVYCAQSRATGIYEGTNQVDHGLVMHVSHLYPVAVGENVISSGDGMIFPQGFALGKITSVVRDNLVYAITTEPLCDLRAIRHCYIVQKGSA